MERSDREKHWRKVYDQLRPDEVSWYQEDVSTSLALIAQAGVSRGGGIIDVGGGSSLLLDALLGRGYTELSVLDIAEAALTNSRNRLGARADEVEWFVDDVTAFVPPRTWDLWHDRAVFHFLTEPEEREAYLRTLNKSVASGGSVIIATFNLDGPKRCSGLDVTQYDSGLLTDVLGAGYTFVHAVDEAHETPTNAVQQFSYFLFRKS